jgi:hypothetical protein
MRPAMALPAQRPIQYPSQKPSYHGPPTLEAPEKPYQWILLVVIILVALGLWVYVFFPR